MAAAEGLTRCNCGASSSPRRRRIEGLLQKDPPKLRMALLPTPQLKFAVESSPDIISVEAKD